MAISKRLRYEILRRDGFACWYCGAKPPGVELTADHVVPVALGGTDDPSNLVAACEACNGGKTSTSPDAPLVASVSEDAVRWSRALAEAAARMQANLSGHREIYDQFDSWWSQWTYGSGKQPIPRPAGWESSIDSFLAAGLPLDMLEWCVRRAMASRAKPDGTWKYMCGVAWRKVTELQTAAKAIAGGLPPAAAEPEDDPTIERGRADLAAELLGQCDEDEIERLKAEAREDRGAVTAERQDIEAVHIAWQEARMGLGWLAHSVCYLLCQIPDEAMQGALRQARVELYDEKGPEFSRVVFAERATEIAVRRYEDKSAADYLGAMPDEERAEWLRYTEVLHEGRVSGRWLPIRAAGYAQSIKGGCFTWPGMCFGPGESIKYCSNRATKFLRFNELECCRNDASHEVHEFCDKHLLVAEEGELKRTGAPVTVASWTSIPSKKDETAVPF